MKPADTYRQRSTSFAAARDRLDGQLKRLANIRMVAFLAGAICLLAVWDVADPYPWVLLVAAISSFVIFFVLVAMSWRRKAKRRFSEEMRRVNEDALSRLSRDWMSLPETQYTHPPNHAYAADLDLFGHASLFQLLGTAVTVPGRQLLRQWLLVPSTSDEIVERQTAVAELAPVLDHRQRMEANARLIGRERPQALRAFLDWIQEECWIQNLPWLVWCARLLPIVSVPSLLLYFTGVFTVPVWALTIGVGLVISLKTYSRMHAVFDLVAAGDMGLRRYAPVFEAAMSGKFESPLVANLKQQMAPAAEELRRLDRILAYTEFRHSGMLHGALQLLLMWDHNVLAVLERWKCGSGKSVEGWVNALGQMEALAALGALAHAHPDWSFPEFISDDSPPTIACEGLGHPLLSSNKCVVNDVTIGPPGSFLFVTGSNMSGKSTLLRSIGVNAVLAQAGGPVFASRMRLPRVSVFTSMRVSDSLDLGISQYMAQLNRLKSIVDGAQSAADAADGCKALFLLDEILQGTNSAERLVAVRRIIGRLMEYSAIGAVTSHELTVPDVPQLSSAARVVHFRETAAQTDAGVTLSFDYKLRPGLSTSTNALKLLEMVGLE